MIFPIILHCPLLPLWSKVKCLRERHHLPYPVAASDSAELSQWLHFSTFSLNFQRLRGIQTFLAYTPLMCLTASAFSTDESYPNPNPAETEAFNIRGCCGKCRIQ